MANHAMGHVAVLVAAARYLARMRELREEVERGEVTNHDAVLAMTYLLGLCDMASLYVNATEHGSAADDIRAIDDKIDSLKSGKYPDDDNLEEEHGHED